MKPYNPAMPSPLNFRFCRRPSPSATTATTAITALGHRRCAKPTIGCLKTLMLDTKLTKKNKTPASNCIINPCTNRFVMIESSTCRAAQVVSEAACQRRASVDPAKIPYHSSLFREPLNRWRGLCVLFTGSVCTLSHLERTPQNSQDLSGPFHSVHSAKCFLPLPLVPNILKLMRSRLDPRVHLRRRVETSRHHWTSRILPRFLIVGPATNVYQFQHYLIIPEIHLYILLSPRNPSIHDPPLQLRREPLAAW